MEFLFQVGVAANHPVKSIRFPKPGRWFSQFVDFVSGERFDRVQQFLKRPENRLAFRVLLLDLRFKRK